MRDWTTLPRGARVGTSSLRRQAQLRAFRPDLELLDLRGNVNTRLAKLDAGEYDAMILACAGLDRLGLGARIRARLAPPQWLPAVAQGAIAIECRAGDASTADAARAAQRRGDIALRQRRARDESQVAWKLHGADRRLLHRGRIGARALGPRRRCETGRLVRADAVGDLDRPIDLGDAVASMLLAQGAGEMLGRLP